MPKILHCFADFHESDAARRQIPIISGLGSGFSHDFAGGKTEPGRVEGMAEAAGARRLSEFPALTGGVAGPSRLVAMARAMAGYDLILSYGWGAINAVMAHRVFGQSFALPPLIHHETGLGESSAGEFAPWRNFYRRIALGSAQSVVVETAQQARLAAEHWHVPGSRLHVAPRGLDAAAFGKAVARDALPGLIKRSDEYWIGSMAAGGDVSGLVRLLDQFADLPQNWHMVIFGERSGLVAITDKAGELELSHRVHLPGTAIDRAAALGLLDIYADCGDGPAFPASVLEAMASGLPVVATSASPAMALLSLPNREHLQSSDETAALLRLAEDPLACREIGKANRARAMEEFDHASAVAGYRTLYSGALGQAI